MKKLCSLAIATLVVACGGGGNGSTNNSAAAPTLNLSAAYASMIQNGNSVLYALSGDCTGYSSETYLPAYATKNWATPAVDVSAVDSLVFDTLSTTSQATTLCTQVFDNNQNEVRTHFYSPTDQTIINSGGTSSYWEVYSEQSPLPTSVSAGSTGVIYKFKDYNGASSTAGNPAYTGTLTYSVHADSTASLLVKIIETGVEFATGQTAWTVITTYRLNADNTLSSLSRSWNANANSGLNAALSVTGTATSSITLDAKAINVASLNAGAINSFNVFDSSNNQCAPAAAMNAAPLSPNSGTTINGIAYAKNSTTTYSPSAFTGGGNCANFNLPLAENNYYDANYALVQQTSVNSVTQSSTNITATNVPYPNAVTIGNTGQLYTYNRISNTSNVPFASGNVGYFVGALTPTKLALFQVQTKNYANPNTRVGRQIWVSSAIDNNVATRIFGYVNDDNYQWRFIPN